MKTTPTSLIQKTVLTAALLLLSGALAATAQTTYTKANNTTALTTSGSWTIVGSPGSGDIGRWNNTVTAANVVQLGAAMNLGQIQIVNPGGAVTIWDSANALTLSGVNGVGIDMSAATQNLTIQTNNLTLGGNQIWKIATGRSITHTGGNGIAFGANILTIVGPGTFNANERINPVTASSSSAGAGIIVSNATISAVIQVSGASAAYINYLGANTALTMSGNNTYTAGEVSTTGNHRQTFTTLTLNPGSTIFNNTARGSSSGNSTAFTTVNRNGGSMADFGAAGFSAGNTFGSSVNGYAFPGTTVATPGTTNVVGWATQGANDWALGRGTAFGVVDWVTNNTLAGNMYTADIWSSAAPGNNVNVTASDAPVSGTTTANSLAFRTAGAFTVTYPAGVNVITTGGILVGSTVGANAATITGGSLTSGNANADSTSDLIVINNNTTAGSSIVINSILADNGGTSVGLTVGSTASATPTGAVQLGAANTFSGTTYISKGILQLNNSLALQNSTFNTTLPGTLSFGTLTAATIGGLSGSGNLSLLNTTPAAVSLTVGGNNANTSYSGSMTGTGGSLTKTGTGTLTMTGASSYSGGTTVSQGTMAFSASGSVAGTLSVSAGATLDVSAANGYSLASTISGSGLVVGSLTNASGGKISPAGDGTIGTNGFANNLTLNGGICYIDFDSGNNTNDQINVGGSLALTSGTIQLNIQNGTLANGTYRIINCAGTPLGAAGNLAVSGFSQIGQAASLQAVSGGLNLVVSTYVAKYLTWQGDGGLNKWDLATTANWTNGATPTAFNNSDIAALDDSSTNQTVNLTGTLSPGSTTVNGTQNYTLAGTGKISGSATLTNNGSGTLTILTTNDNSGVTVINAGTVQVGNGTTAGGAIGSGAVLDNSALVFNLPAGSQSAIGAASGSGTLTKSGNGTLVLNGADTLAGATTISAGTLKQGATSVLPNGAGAGDTTVNGNLDMGGQNGTVNGLTGSGTVDNSVAGSMALSAGANNANGDFSGVIKNTTGTVGLTKIGNGTLKLSGTNIYSGTTTVSAGTLQISNSVAIPGNDLAVASTGTLDLNANSPTVGALTGSGIVDDVTAGGTVTFTLGNNNNGGTFSGIIRNSSGTVNLTKNGNGTQVLTGNNTFSGAAVVNGGTLQLNSGGVINNAAADGIGTANGNGQMLVSGGSLTANSFNVATPSLGLTVSSGSATFSGTSGALTMNANGGSQAAQNGLITVTGGALSAASLAIGRNGGSQTTQPTTGSTTVGVYVNGGSANISGDVSVCTQGAANSGNSMRIDSGSFTVGGSVTVAGGTSGGRWSDMDVNGGTFEVDNTANGFNIGGNNVGNAILLIRAGVAKIGKVTLGNSGQTFNTNALNMTGGSLYVGSGGIVSALNVVPANSPITMTNATLGAWADWSSANAIDLNGTNTMKAADDLGNPHNFTLSGSVGGNFNSAITKTGNGTLTLSGANFFTNGATVSAGKLNINGYNALGGAYYGGLTLAGGTLQYSTNSTGNGSLDISLTPNSSVGITLAAGTDTIDVNGNSVTYANPIGNGGSGSLVVQSTAPGGVLNLTAGNSYSGTTTVSSGTLRVNNTSGSATAAGNVTVNSGGTLGGNGIISGAVEIASGGILAPGNSIGTNTVGGLTLDSGSRGKFEFTASANDQTVVTGSGGFVINDPSQTAAFYIYSAGGVAPFSTPGTYNLIKFTGTAPTLDSSWTTVSAINPHVANRQPSSVYSFAISGGYLTVTIAPNGSSVSGTWTNSVGGNWSDVTKWDSNPNKPQNPGDSATFGNGTGFSTVALTFIPTIGTLTFNNANSYSLTDGGGGELDLQNSGAGNNIYVVGGSANSISAKVGILENTTIAVNSGQSVAISGTIDDYSTGSILTLNGSGTVALSGVNSYAGTTLGGGTLQVGNDAALGSGDLSVTANGTLQAGTGGLVLGNNVQIASGTTATVDTSGQDLELDGSISDITSGGSLTKIGNGKLTLTGFPNGFSGNTTISGGVLAISSSFNLFVTPNIILNGGVLLGDIGIDQDGPVANIGIGPLGGGTGGTGMLDAASAQTFLINGAIGSAGNSGVNNLVVNSLSGDNGTVALTVDNTFNGSTVISNGVLLLKTSGGLQNSTLNYNNQGGQLHFNTGVTAATLGGLTGAQDLMLTNLSGVGVSPTVGGNGSSTIYSGGLQDVGTAASLTKAGNGNLALAGTNNCGGTTTVNAGQLQVTNNGVLDTGVANILSAAGVQLVVNGGTLVATNASSVGNPSGGLHVSAGFATYLTSLTVNSASSGAMIGVTGGSLTAGSLTLGRTGLNDSTQPAAGSTADGLYINGGAVTIITNLNVGTPNAANSSANVRVDSGSLTVGGTLTVALNNGGRWSVVDVNGGTLTVTNTTTGINLGGPAAGNTLLLVRAGVVNAGIIGFGNAAQTNGDTAVVNVTNGTLYVGAGGIVQVSSNVSPVITFYGGLVGASADWACSNTIVLGDPTIQAADSLSVAHNIALSGILSGTNLTKTGSGTLTLSAANTYSGITTIGNGTLTLGAGSSIAGTTQVGIGAGATFNVSALGGYTFTGTGPAQTLAGNSTSGTANIAAGGNTVTLNSGAGTLFQADGSGSTIGKISVAGNVTLNNNTVTINVSGGGLGGVTNRLLDCTGTLTGSANITPVFTGIGLDRGASAFVVTTPGSNGHVDLVVNVPLTPTQSAGITGISLAGTNVVLNATNGQSGGLYYLLTSTNIADSIGVWAPAATNIITTNGVGDAFTFIGTNVVNTNDAQQYYILSNTNNRP